MKRALLLVAAASLGACAQNDISLSITQMQVVSQTTGCVAIASSGGVVGRDRGLLDLANVTTSGYIAVPVIRNNLMSLVNGIEYNAIQLVGANVKLSQVGGAPLVLPSGQSSFFYAAAAGRLDPGGTAPMFVEALPAPAAKSLAGMVPAGGLFTLIAEIRPVGMRQSDQVIGGPIQFPIDICSGCLDTTVACPLPKGTVATTPCFPQQDDPSICCVDAASNQTLCGGAAPVAM
jgi:hypothetical protein